MHDYKRHIAFSNHRRCLNVENSDRRMLMIECDSSMADNKPYFRELVAEMKGVDFLHSAFSYFAHRDISEFEPREIPVTSLKQEQKYLCLPKSIQFLKEIWTDYELDDEFDIHTSDLYSLFEHYSAKVGIKSTAIVQRSCFIAQLQDFGLRERGTKFRYTKDKLVTANGADSKLCILLKNILGYSIGYTYHPERQFAKIEPLRYTKGFQISKVQTTDLLRKNLKDPDFTLDSIEEDTPESVEAVHSVIEVNMELEVQHDNDGVHHTADDDNNSNYPSITAIDDESENDYSITAQPSHMPVENASLPSSEETEISLNKKTVPQLKLMCRERGIKSSGRCSELIARIFDHDNGVLKLKKIY